uniref:ShKT domain-containing protein n=1 Tax=Parascaris univalens TaxID=6257 RepID=A0A915C1E3_PARUN
MCPTDPVHSRCHNFDGRYYCCAYMKPKCYDKASFCRFTKSLCNDPNYWHLISDECEATCGFCHEQRPFEEILTTIPTDITRTSSVVDDNIANRNDSIKGNISADNPPLESIQQNRGRYMRPTNQDKSRLQENPSDNPFSIFPRTIAKKLPEGHNSTTILSDGTKSSLVSMHSEGARKTNVSLIQAHDKRPHSEVNIDRSQKAEAENVTMDTSKGDVVDEIFHQLKAASNMKQHFDGFNDHNSWETDNSSTLWNRTQYGRLNSAIAKNPVNISEEKISENITRSIIDNVSEMRSNPISKHDPSHN